MFLPHRNIRAGALGFGLALALSACSEPTDPGPPATPPAPEEEVKPPPYEQTGPRTYVPKIKTILTGLAATDEEVALVTKDPKALAGLIDQWMALPEFEGKMLDFFRNAFQQGQISTADFQDQFTGTGLRGTAATQARILRAMQDSFPRTAWALLQEGRPFNETINTDRFMLTPPLMAYLAFLDQRHVNDRGAVTDKVQPTVEFMLTPEKVPLEQTLNPNDPAYMIWHNPINVPVTAPIDCQGARSYQRNALALFDFLMGVYPASGLCRNTFTGPSIFTEEDFNAWRMIRVRAPRPGEETTRFWDILKMRNGDELVLNIPRVGFFSTPAFFANWQTNTSNQSRVTMNQALIVALGKSFDDSNTITPVTGSTKVDQDHSADPACYACHKTLDPMRQAFRQAYNYFYHEQTDATLRGAPGVFAFDGITRPLNDISDLGKALSEHPRYARAWTQKLCYYGNSSACVEDDPEFLRVVQAFQKSGHNLKVLVRELFSSPLMTAEKNTKTFMELGLSFGIARRDHFCTSLSNRLGLPDVCGMNTQTPTAFQTRARIASIGVPADGYSRGSEAPTISTDPGLFFRIATETLCRVVAEQVADPAAPLKARYSSQAVPAAVDDLVKTVMGLPKEDPRHATARQILSEHFDGAKAAGATATEALRSTFVLACSSPSSVGLGQ